MSTMANVLNYKGYFAKIEYSAEDQVLHGKIEGIADLVTFESDLASEIEQEFHSAVDDYLLFCEEMGKEPDKAYKGSFNIRISPELHKTIAMVACRKGVSLNETVEQALHMYTNQGITKGERFYDKQAAFLDSISYQASNMWRENEIKGCKSQFDMAYATN